MEFKPLNEKYDALARFDVVVPPEELARKDALPQMYADFKETLAQAEVALNGHKEKFKSELRYSAEDFKARCEATRKDFQENAPFGANYDVDSAQRICRDFHDTLDTLQVREQELRDGLAMFNIDHPPSKDLAATLKELDWLDRVWDLTDRWNRSWNNWKNMRFSSLVVRTMEEQCQK